MPRYHYEDSDGFVWEARDVGQTLSGGVVEYDDYFLYSKHEQRDSAKDCTQEDI